MNRRQNTRPCLESLEGRYCPASLNLFTDATGHLRIEGQADDLQLNFLANDQVQIVADGSPLNGGNPYPATGLTVRVREEAAAQQNLAVNMNGFFLSGNLTIQGLATAERLDIFGASGGVRGDLSLSDPGT